MTQERELRGPLGWAFRHPKALNTVGIIGALLIFVLALAYDPDFDSLLISGTLLGLGVLTRVLWPYTLGGRAAPRSAKALAAAAVLGVGLVALVGEVIWFALR